MEARLDIVEELWRKCVPNSTIERQLSVQWKITRRSVRGYIHRIEKQVAARRAADPQGEQRKSVEFDRTLHMFDDIYLRSVEGDAAGTDAAGKPKVKGRDLKTATIAAHRRAQLLGLYPANRFEVTGANGKPLEVSPMEAVDKLAAELARAAERQGQGGGAVAPPAPAGDQAEGGDAGEGDGS
jgi:hypothetical protein